jgi:hypothetical protein
VDVNNSILQDIRVAVGLSSDTADYDTELLMHINSAIGKLNQNGVGKFLVVNDELDKWIDLQDETQVDGNKYFQMIPVFVALSTKIIFDPPPPSAVPVYQDNLNQSLWRLKIAYEETYTAPVINNDL